MNVVEKRDRVPFKVRVDVRMFAQRIGLREVHPRHPCVMPSDFGLDVIRRYSADLPDLSAAA